MTRKNLFPALRRFARFPRPLEFTRPAWQHLYQNGLEAARHESKDDCEKKNNVRMMHGMKLQQIMKPAFLKSYVREAWHRRNRS